MFKLPLFAAVLLWAMAIGLVATGAFWLFYHWVLEPVVERVPVSTILNMALTVAAGTGGLVLLVVNYRKQQDLEESRFVERFGAAAAQLGHEDVAVRLAGVYAMAAVAERTRYRGQIQQCIDVLCGYLRLPYDPSEVAIHQTSAVIKIPGRDVADCAREKHFKYRQNDGAVRLTIVRVITEHLQPKARNRWSSYDFDFTKAYLGDANFSSAVFSGERVTFIDAVFSGEQVSFDRAVFSSERVLFDYAVFSGEWVSFDRAVFSGERVAFDRAVFSGERVAFIAAEFSGEKVSFNRTVFSCQAIDFTRPARWDPPPEFDWDNSSSEITKPDCVNPRQWPPAVWKR